MNECLTNQSSSASRSVLELAVILFLLMIQTGWGQAVQPLPMTAHPLPGGRVLYVIQQTESGGADGAAPATGSSPEQKKLECSVVKQPDASCKDKCEKHIPCEKVLMAGIGPSWNCGYTPIPIVIDVIVPECYEKHSYTVCRNFPYDTCEDDKQCVTCVRTWCAKVPKEGVTFIPPNSENDERIYECRWVEDYNVALRSIKACCYGYTFEEHFAE